MDVVLGQKYKVSRKSCFTNLQGHNRFSTRITIKRLMTPRKMMAEVRKGELRQSTATVKITRDSGEGGEQSQISTRKKRFKRDMEEEEVSLKEQFKRQLARSREENQLNLRERVSLLKTYQQQRQNFLNYLAYLIYYVNQEEKECQQKTEIKLQTFFKAVQIFDSYLCSQESKMDQA